MDVWKELRDSLQGDSWTSLKLDPAFFCLRDFPGHLIGRIIVHVDDMLLATNNSHQAESHISRLLSKNDIKDVNRAVDGEGVLYCGKRVRTVPDDLKPVGLALRQDQTEFAKARCERASMSRVRAGQEGAHCTTSAIRKMRSMTGSLHGVTGGTSRRVIRDKSVAEETISAPAVRPQARRTNSQAFEESAWNWFEV